MCPKFDCTAGRPNENIKFWVKDTNLYTVELYHADHPEPPKEAYTYYVICKIKTAEIRGVAKTQSSWWSCLKTNLLRTPGYFKCCSLSNSEAHCSLTRAQAPAKSVRNCIPEPSEALLLCSSKPCGAKLRKASKVILYYLMATIKENGTDYIVSSSTLRDPP